MLDAATWRESLLPLPLSDVRSVLREMDAATLRREFGDGFLVTSLDPKVPAIGARDPTISQLDVNDMLLKPQRDRRWVYLLANTGRTAFPGFVAVGRTRNNDVIINHLSVSRFHSMIVRTDRGFGIHDAGSSHGTFVDGSKALQKGDGAPPVPLTNASLVRFGTIETMFYDAAGLIALP